MGCASCWLAHFFFSTVDQSRLLRPHLRTGVATPDRDSRDVSHPRRGKAACGKTTASDTPVSSCSGPSHGSPSTRRCCGSAAAAPTNQSTTSVAESKPDPEQPTRDLRLLPVRPPLRVQSERAHTDSCNRQSTSSRSCPCR